MESGTRERTTECEGRVMFSLGHVAIFPFGKRRTVYKAGEGRRRLLQRHVSRAHEALTPRIYSPEWKHTRVCAKHCRVAFTRRTGLRYGQCLKEFTLTFTAEKALPNNETECLESVFSMVPITQTGYH